MYISYVLYYEFCKRNQELKASINSACRLHCQHIKDNGAGPACTTCHVTELTFHWHEQLIEHLAFVTCKPVYQL